MPNVRDDDAESLWFADEGAELDDAEDWGQEYDDDDDEPCDHDCDDACYDELDQWACTHSHCFACGGCGCPGYCDDYQTYNLRPAETGGAAETERNT